MQKYDFNEMSHDVRAQLSAVTLPFMAKYARMVDEDGEQMHEAALAQALIEMALILPIVRGKALGVPNTELVPAVFEFSQDATAKMIERILGVKVNLHTEMSRIDLSQFDKGTDDDGTAAKVADIIDMFKRGQ